MTGPDLTFLFVEPFVYAVTFVLTGVCGLCLGWLLYKAPSVLWRVRVHYRRLVLWIDDKKQRRILRVSGKGFLAALHRPRRTTR